jgi:cobalt/nickel transport system permease protein
MNRSCLFFCVAAFFCSMAWESVSAERWPGVDQTVVERYATEYGREPRDPWINTDKGDLLLFVFALAGALGGFVAGYNWRKLFCERTPGSSAPPAKAHLTCRKEPAGGNEDA